MKRKSPPLILILTFLALSCNGPETVVTNHVYRDGSVLRRIEMRIVDDSDYGTSDLKVPFDSTWIITDSLEISDNGDTTRVKMAEKLFRNVEEINNAYRNDSGANRSYDRSASFTKKFKWFSTEFRFSEQIGKIMEYGYPLENFLDKEELLFFYSPQTLIDKHLQGPDSTRYKMLHDSVSRRTEEWILRSLISEWIGKMGHLTQGKNTEMMIVELRNKEEDIYKAVISKNSEQFDSLWQEGTILRELIGQENAERYRAEADSAIQIATDEVISGFSSYSLQTIMPGRLTGTNGFIDSSDVVLWPVSSDYFLTQPYEMWAESKEANVWAWVVSGLFLVFVLTGVVIWTIKKAE